MSSYYENRAEECLSSRRLPLSDIQSRTPQRTLRDLLSRACLSYARTRARSYTYIYMRVASLRLCIFIRAAATFLSPANYSRAVPLVRCRKRGESARKPLPCSPRVARPIDQPNNAPRAEGVCYEVMVAALKIPFYGICCRAAPARNEPPRRVARALFF